MAITDFQRLLESLPAGVCVQAGGRFVFANAALARLLGYSTAELKRMGWADLVPGDKPASAGAGMEATLAAPGGASTAPTLCRLRTKSGETSHVDVSVLHMDWEGTPAVAFLVAGRSDRVALERGLRETDRMAALGVLAAGVAHEMNNPLAYVVANVAFAREHVAEFISRNPEPALVPIEEALDEASQGIDRVRRVVSGLKTFSRSEEQEELVDLAQVLESTIRMAKVTARHRAAIVQSVGRLPPVKGRATQLGQVLLNLLMNASDAIGQDEREGRITVRATQTPEGGALVEVEDTGAGIPAETLQHVFEPFFTTKPAGIGTGLGLAVCKNIVEEHEGTIELESEPGIGTVVRVTLPAAPAGFAPHVSSAALRAVRPQRYRVLVVDDDPLVLKGMKRLLRAHEVTTAAGGQAALELLARKSDFDAILCDLMMPGVTGVDVFARLSGWGSGLERKIVFVSGGAVTIQARELLERVPNLRVEKPVDPRRIDEILMLAAHASESPPDRS